MKFKFNTSSNTLKRFQKMAKEYNLEVVEKDSFRYQIFGMGEQIGFVSMLNCQFTAQSPNALGKYVFLEKLEDDNDIYIYCMSWALKIINDLFYSMKMDFLIEHSPESTRFYEHIIHRNNVAIRTKLNKKRNVTIN